MPRAKILMMRKAGDWIDDKIESWVTNSNSIEDEEREFSFIYIYYTFQNIYDFYRIFLVIF